MDQSERNRRVSEGLRLSWATRKRGNATNATKESAMPCNDPDHMEALVPCDRCKKWIKLDDSNFTVPEWCQCRGSCSHGICDECKRELELGPEFEQEPN